MKFDERDTKLKVLSRKAEENPTFMKFLNYVNIGKVIRFRNSEFDNIVNNLVIFTSSVIERPANSVNSPLKHNPSFQYVSENMRNGTSRKDNFKEKSILGTRSFV